MTVQTATPRTQRLAVLATVCGLHCLALFAILLGRADAFPSPAKPGALLVLSIMADNPSPTPPPPPALPSKRADDSLPLREISFSDQPNSTATNAPLGGCATLEVVTNALVADRAAVAAIHDAPPETRSIAGALMIWNSGWNGAASTINAPLGQVRAVAERSLRSVDDTCLDEAIIGPRLVPIPVGESTMFVVFGSGIWRWRELMFDADGKQQGEFYNRVPPMLLWPF